MLSFSVFLYSGQYANFELPEKSIGNLKFHVELSQFEGVNGKNNVDISYSLNLNQFWQRDTSISETQFQVVVDISGSKIDNIIKSDFQKTANKETKDGNSSIFIDSEKFELLPDTVNLIVRFKNSQLNREGVFSKKVVIKNFSRQLDMSDPLFLLHIQKTSGESKFNRHGVMMIPNAERLYNVSVENPFVMFYFEVNNLTYIQNQSSFYSLRYQILDLVGNEIESKVYESIPISSENTSRVEKFSAKNYNTGVYRLVLSVTDLETFAEAKFQRYFTIHSAAKPSNLILPMTESDVKKYYNQIKYIASPAELEVFKQLDNQGKQEFLLKFWKSKDPEPDTPDNEYMIEHFARIAYCEANFDGGINSDMARVYILYGPPFDIRRMISSREYSKPVIIWEYALEGTTEFVFVDRIGDNQFQLVHSSLEGEYQNPDWVNDLK
jgi:GWxTD domain-containing protein